MVERHLDMWPEWAPRAAAVPAVALALLTPVVHSEGQASVLLFLLLAISALPWLIEATGRRIGPWRFAATALVPLAVVNWAGGTFGLDMTHDAQLSLMLVVWTVGCVAATNPPRVSAPIVALGALIPVGRTLLHGFDAWPFWLPGILFAAVTGLLMHGQQHLLTQLRSAQEALAAEAVSQERQRIAREVHDVIAHHLTVTMLHLTAARMALRRDRDDAEESLAEAERLGRQALADVRRTVGLLHDGSGAGTSAALPGACDLEGLVVGFRAAGVDVSLECAVDLSRLGPAASLAVHRAVQEALVNAAKHAPGAPVRVALRRAGGGLVVEVVDRGGQRAEPADGSGVGLLGMRERVEALGGTMTAGPDGKGWRVSCTIPMAEAAL